MSKLTVPASAVEQHVLGRWALYRLPVRPSASFLWQPFKLMLVPEMAPAPRWGRLRAFRLHWSPLESRLQRHRENAALARQEPDLHARLLVLLCERYGPAWLGARHTEEEIQAERERLATKAQAAPGGRGRRRA